MIKTNLRLRWVLMLLVGTLPLAALLLAGLGWLWEHDLLMPWLGLSAVLALGSWLVSRYTPQTLAPDTLQIRPEPRWSASGQRAWQEVEKLATEASQRGLEDWQALWSLLQEVLERVARQFHPEQREPVLELRVPYLLRVIELLARDLRLALTENIPGSHILTVNDMLRGQRLALQGRQLYNLYRLVSFGVNPVSAAIREMKGLAWEKLLESSISEVRSWLIDAYVKKVGYYAVELYSGHLQLDDELVDQPSSATRRDLRKLEKLQERVAQEPLRVLVLGQVKAGKSSLINALFGATRALTDVLPETASVTPYLLEREGLERALILDTAGYEDIQRGVQSLQEARQEILRADLILLVCAANSAARQADRQMLDELRSLFLTNTGEAPPPIITVVSHIDRLRPAREWQPPYDVQQPESAKAESIRAAVEAVAEDVNLPTAQVVPVCLHPERLYNLEEGLLPTILLHLDASRRLKYLRCLKDRQSEQYWGMLWTQAKSSGRVLVKTGTDWLEKQLEDLLRRP